MKLRNLFENVEPNRIAAFISALFQYQGGSNRLTASAKEVKATPEGTAMYNVVSYLMGEESYANKRRMVTDVEVLYTKFAELKYQGPMYRYLTITDILNYTSADQLFAKIMKDSRSVGKAVSWSKSTDDSLGMGMSPKEVLLVQTGTGLDCELIARNCRGTYPDEQEVLATIQPGVKMMIMLDKNQWVDIDQFDKLRDAMTTHDTNLRASLAAHDAHNANIWG